MLYLDRELIARRKLSLAEVQQAVAVEIDKLDDVALAVTSSDIESGSILMIIYIHLLLTTIVKIALVIFILC